MGYGAGAFLLAVGLILALAVQDNLNGVDLTTVGWILAAVGALVIVLTAMTWNRSHRTVATTTHPDGSQTVQDRRSQY
jgi:hypothetical protein